MILLSLGTHQQPFPRALDLIAPLASQGVPIIVQHGSTAPRSGMQNVTWIEFMPFDDVVDTMIKADNVICHAGVGSIMTALQVGHTPVVVPRLADHGEHVDDHQLDIATRFAERGLVRCVTTATDLAPLLTPRNIHDDRPIGKGSVALRAAVADAVTVGIASRTRRFVGLRRSRSR